MELTRCPVCRARFQGGEPPEQPCRRCRSDLSLLRRCYLQARYEQKRARRALVQEDVSTALAAAARALRLVDLPSTRRLFCATLAAAGQQELASSLLATLEPPSGRG